MSESNPPVDTAADFNQFIANPKPPAATPFVTPSGKPFPNPDHPLSSENDEWTGDPVADRKQLVDRAMMPSVASSSRKQRTNIESSIMNISRNAEVIDARRRKRAWRKAHPLLARLRDILGR